MLGGRAAQSGIWSVGGRVEHDLAIGVGEDEVVCESTLIFLRLSFTAHRKDGHVRKSSIKPNPQITSSNPLQRPRASASPVILSDMGTAMHSDGRGCRRACAETPSSALTPDRTQDAIRYI